MISLKQTENEYLLFIPAAQKERARSIDGRRWDPERKCWVYPRNGRMYDMLISEFGDDISDLKIRRPTRPEQNLPLAVAAQFEKNLQSENQMLKHDLAQIRESLEVIKESNGNARSAEVRNLQTALASRESQIAELKATAEIQDDELTRMRKQLEETQAAVEQLKVQNQLLSGELESHKKDHRSDEVWINEMVVRLAVEASGNNTKFANFIKESGFNRETSVALGRELEGELRKRVNDHYGSFPDLIAQASDAGILSQDGKDLAHTIRKQRNKMAHPGADPRTFKARIILSLCCGALLWPELSE